jgi:hypothetical protein
MDKVAVTPVAPRMFPGKLARFVRERYEVFRQTEQQVVVRPVGARFLVPFPRPDLAAQEHWEYAWLSVAAYGRTVPVLAGGTSVSDIARARLTGVGWVPWQAFTDAELHGAISRHHLRVEVWEKVDANAVKIAVAFGGSVFTSLQDWRSNLRWFRRTLNDEYTEVVERLIPQFLAALSRRMALDPRRYRRVTIIATGHSLGGGLAQQFACSLREPPDFPRVSHVYVFDSSPVTGYSTVAETRRTHNCQDLSIDRIYERGDLFAVLRSLTSAFVPPSSVNPAIRGTRYMFIHSFNPITEHSVVKLAETLEILAALPPADSAG